MQGNWGHPGTVVMPEKREYMWQDIKSTPTTFVCLQECYSPIYEHLLSPGTEGLRTNNGQGVEWERRPTYEYMGARGPEDPKERALVIAARTTHVVNCRMRLYWKKHTKYRKSGKGLKVGETRVMAVTFKMKDWYLTQKK